MPESNSSKTLNDMGSGVGRTYDHALTRRNAEEYFLKNLDLDSNNDYVEERRTQKDRVDSLKFCKSFESLKTLSGS